MGKHQAWRKEAKKLRRKRVRQRLARNRDALEKEEQTKRQSDPHFLEWINKQERLEEFAEFQEKQISELNHQQWLKREAQANKEWLELQVKLNQIREERVKQNERIKQEWHREQEKLKKQAEAKRKELEDKENERKKLLDQIQHFVENGGQTPEHLKTNFETNPNKPICPFFKKTSTCRFGDACSRNHIRPGASKIILIPNFYSHYSLNQNENEHGTDSSLEFESREVYDHFENFFFDVVPEMEKCGKVTQFNVCCNHEAHLRGNVYVEYKSTREAVKSYQVFNGRWYAGKQLSVEFCGIDTWKTAICGLHFKKRCPKGSACNFLHVFINPGNLYDYFNYFPKERTTDRTKERTNNDRQNWRWSESPDRAPKTNEWDYHLDGERSHRSSSRRKNHRSSHRVRSKSRSKSRERSRSSRKSSRSSRRHRSRSSERSKVR